MTVPARWPFVVWVALVLAGVMWSGARGLAWPGGPPPAVIGGRPAESGYKLGPGPWPVALAQRLVLKDATRRRNVEMTVRYPGGKAVRNHHPFPLVIFSADPGDGTELPDLAGHWVSHGFVVITLLNEREAPRTSRPAERVPFDVRQLDRLGDVVFVLGALDQVERRLDGFHGRHAARIDRERMGVAGYSMGALTAQMAIGVKVRVAGREGEAELRDAGDARFKAAVLISPQGTINRMLTRDSWNEVSKPLLVVTGSHDVVPGSRETPESRQEPFLLARPGHKFLLFLEGATHTSYSLFASQSRANSEPAPDAVDPDPRVSANATDAVTLAFWDAFLLNDERGREYLASDEVKKLSGGRAQLRRR